MAGFDPPAAAQQEQFRSLLSADTCAVEATREAPAAAVPASSCDRAGPRGRTRLSKQRGERLSYRAVLGHILHKLHTRELPPDLCS